jgi:hypothetical protein
MNQVFDRVSNGGSCDDLSKGPSVKQNRPLDDQVGKPRSSCTWCECVNTPLFCLHFCERPNDFDDFVRKRENMKTNKWNGMETNRKDGHLPGAKISLQDQAD